MKLFLSIGLFISYALALVAIVVVCFFVDVIVKLTSRNS